MVLPTPIHKSAQVEPFKTPRLSLVWEKRKPTTCTFRMYISLTQGKYTWQHNQVHQEFGEMIEKNRETKQNTQETNI